MPVPAAELDSGVRSGFPAPQSRPHSPCVTIYAFPIVALSSITMRVSSTSFNDTRRGSARDTRPALGKPHAKVDAGGGLVTRGEVRTGHSKGAVGEEAS